MNAHSLAQPVQQAGQVSTSRTRTAFTRPTLPKTHQHNLQPSLGLCIQAA
jgi:hypothetical protein